MSKNLPVKSSPALAPMLPGLVDEVHLRRLVASFTVSVEGQRIYIDRLPVAVEREQLRQRRAMLQAKLKAVVGEPQAALEAKIALAQYFDGHPSLAGQDKGALVEAYMFVLQKYPLFAILAAIEDAMANRLPKQSIEWVPNSAMMGAAADRHTTAVAGEVLKIDQIAAAKHLIRALDDPEARKRVGDGLQMLANALREKSQEGGLMTAAERAAAIEARRAGDKKLILREWNDLGVAPVLDQSGQPIPVALARSIGALPLPGAKEGEHADR